MFYSTAHTHSTWCDGKNTIKEMAEAAIKNGLSDLGCTSHSPARFDPTCPGVADELAYQEAVRKLQKEYKERLTISCGLEWDYFSPTPLAGYDYTIGSVHYFPIREGVYKSVDSSPEDFKWTLHHWYQDDFIAMARDYYHLLIRHVRENQPTIVGHFDLIMKFNDRLHYLTDSNQRQYQELARASLKEVCRLLQPYGGMVEVNTGGISRGWKQDPYPDAFLLKDLQTYQTPVIITSDSHHITTLTYYFKETQQLLKELGFTQSTQLKDGKFQEIPFD